MKKLILLPALLMLLCGGTILSPHERKTVNRTSPVEKLEMIAATMDSTATDLERSAQILKNFSK